MFPVDGTSICLHSDAPNAIEVAKALADEITSLGCQLAPESQTARNVA